MNKKQNQTDNEIQTLEQKADRAIKRGMVAGGLLAADIVAIMGYAFTRKGEIGNDPVFPALLVALLALYVQSAAGFSRYAKIQSQIISRKEQR